MSVKEWWGLWEWAVPVRDCQSGSFWVGVVCVCCLVWERHSNVSSIKHF